MSRATAQQWAAYTLDGTAFLARLTVANLAGSLNTFDTSGGAASNSSAGEGRRTTRHSFTMNLGNGSGVHTADQTAVIAFGTDDLKCFATSANVSVRNTIVDGTGQGCKDFRPILTKRQITASTSRYQSVGVKRDILWDWFQSAAPADRVRLLDIEWGAFLFAANMRLTSLTENQANAQLNTIDAQYSFVDGLIRPGTGSIFHTAFAGDGLLTLSHVTNSFDPVTGLPAGTGVRAGIGAIESMTVTCPQDGIATVQGTLVMMPDWTFTTT